MILSSPHCMLERARRDQLRKALAAEVKEQDVLKALLEKQNKLLNRVVEKLLFVSRTRVPVKPEQATEAEVTCNICCCYQQVWTSKIAVKGFDWTSCRGCLRAHCPRCAVVHAAAVEAHAKVCLKMKSARDKEIKALAKAEKKADADAARALSGAKRATKRRKRQPSRGRGRGRGRGAPASARRAASQPNAESE